MPRDHGAQPKLGKRPEVLAVEGSNAAHPASAAGSAASNVTAAVGRVAVRAIAVRLAGAPPRGNGRRGPTGAGARPLPTRTP